ncbi:molybdopterin-dependent oxidoreductase [Paenibacillus dauci]|uniref:molybdopterin-dependent oxidoreductase n=1 Tax=Paenibacillus dauci TaxID=1567106 RepID=UPI000619966C|nr:molybdopterin-dependent oxidoreductase [Paenibacillus dauci]
MSAYIQQPDGIFKTVCSLDCPDQCGLLVHKQNGKITKIAGDPEHPVTRGNICNKVRHMAERIYDEQRLTQPLKRVGPKGSRQFEPITWDEAIETITSHWKSLITEHGPESILPYSFYGNMGNINAEGMDRRFFYRLGASQIERTICTAAGGAGFKYTMGGSIGTDPEDTVHTRLFILWGINAVSTNMHQITLAQQARKQGAKIVVIDVHRNQTGRMADWFIPILPGTDTALALGLMHILFAENRVDEHFLHNYTVGHEELREHVQSYDPVTVSGITGVPVDDIYKLARMYSETSPAMIRIGNGLQHHDNGGMNTRAITCLSVLTGQWLVRGGGAIRSNSAYLAHNAAALQRPDLLQNRNTRSFNMNQLGRALTDTQPPVHSLYVYSCNPAVVAPRAAQVRQGLEREDLFTVVHDLFLTETAAYADIILPATSSFENLDFYTSYWHHYMQLGQPIIEAYGQSKSNTEVFRLLAAAMGFEETELQDSDEQMIRQALDHPANPYLQGIHYDALQDHHYIKANRSAIYPERLETPSGKVELYSSTMAQIGLPPLPTYIPLQEQDRHNYIFVPGPTHNFLNSTFSNNAKHAGMEKMPRLFLNTADAENEGIMDGDTVIVSNQYGSCELIAAVGETVLPGVVVSQGLWADTSDHQPAHLVNALTPDRLSDMGGGATFFSGRVDLQKKQLPVPLESII